uniref:Protein krueppel n=1 Tax=Rhabditophanes sp. KR3021 TaxID=114890 RepID=A0AC35U355_9BILA
MYPNLPDSFRDFQNENTTIPSNQPNFNSSFFLDQNNFFTPTNTYSPPENQREWFPNSYADHSQTTASATLPAGFNRLLLSETPPHSNSQIRVQPLIRIPSQEWNHPNRYSSFNQLSHQPTYQDQPANLNFPGTSFTSVYNQHVSTTVHVFPTFEQQQQLHKPLTSTHPPTLQHHPHMLNEDGKLFSCQTCGKQYCRKSTLKAHFKQHMSGQRPFTCKLCGKGFSQAANLTAHTRVHTGEKPFRCSTCNRHFSQSSSLVTHKRTHSGERPYPCKHCDKAFTDSSTLTKHLRTHSGIKPYGCEVCQMKFSQSGNLHRHMKTHKQLAPSTLINNNIMYKTEVI